MSLASSTKSLDVEGTRCVQLFVMKFICAFDLNLIQFNILLIILLQYQLIVGTETLYYGKIHLI
jgi:hypothetical protein